MSITLAQYLKEYRFDSLRTDSNGTIGLGEHETLPVDLVGGRMGE